MAKVIDQVITDKYAAYNGDCIEVMAGMPKASIHMSVYSPPFAALYTYSDDVRDLSNSRNSEEFFSHYELVVKELTRITKPGRFTAVHTADIVSSVNLGAHLTDFPGEVIRLHERLGWKYVARHHIWKEPLGVRNRTMSKGLAHKTITVDALMADSAGADYLLMFRRDGKSEVPVTHERGLLEYFGAEPLPADCMHWKGWEGKQTLNKYSHNIWRRYASSCWHDVRLGNVLPYRQTREEKDEKHVHPLQLDVIARAIELRSNPGEIVFTPFMGVGSEVYQAVCMGRIGMGAELATKYFTQAVKNLEDAGKKKEQDEMPLFANDETAEEENQGLQ